MSLSVISFTSVLLQHEPNLFFRIKSVDSTNRSFLRSASPSRHVSEGRFPRVQLRVVREEDWLIRSKTLLDTANTLTIRMD